MRKFLIAGLLSLAAYAGSPQSATAWVECRFGIGLDFCWQSGGNSALWGLWNNGQVPGPWGNGLSGPGYVGTGYPPIVPVYPAYGYGLPNYYGYPGAGPTPLTPPTPLPDFPNNFWFYP